MQRCEVIWLVYFISLFINSRQNEEFERLICFNDSMRFNYIAINDQLVAYLRLPFNHSFDKVIFQHASNLEFNFDLSPTKILFRNRNQITKLIRKSEQFKIDFDSSGDLRLFTFRSNDELCKESIRSCYEHCWSGNLSLSKKSPFHSPQYQTDSTDLICTKNDQLVHHELSSNKSRILSAKFDASSGFALVKIRNLNARNWLLFGDKVANVYLYDSNSFMSRWPVSGLYQPNELFFGCPQSFCSRASFDDIVYDSNQLMIIYRGGYYYELLISTVPNDKEFDLQLDSHYLNPEYAKRISSNDASMIEQLQYFDAIELIHPRDANPLRIHIKDDMIYTFDHLKNSLINITKLDNFLPKPFPNLVDSMFFYSNHLHLLSGSYIYSYFYDGHDLRTLSFRSLDFKFRLPSYVESAIAIRNRIYFFKDNRFYLAKVDSSNNIINQINISGPFGIFDRFLSNCSQLIGRHLKDNDYKDKNIESYKDVNFRQLKYGLPSIVLFAIFIVVFMMIIISLCIYCEFLSPKKRSYFINSLRNKSAGFILRGNSSLSPSGKEFIKHLETSRLRYLNKNKQLSRNKIEETDNIKMNKSNSTISE